MKRNAVVLFLMMAVSMAAQAALPAAASTALADVSSAVTEILAAVWPIVGAVVTGFVLIKLFRRGTNKI